MDLNDYFRFVLALVFVLSLIGLLSWAARRYGLGGRIAASAPGAARRVRIVEVTSIDAKRRLVLLRRDDGEHLILIGGPNDLIVETGISPPPGGDRQRNGLPAVGQTGDDGTAGLENRS